MTESENKKFRRLKIAKRVLLGIIILYVIFFIASNTDSLSPDNVKRLIFNIKKTFSDDKQTEISIDTSNGFSSALFKDGFVTLTNGSLAVYGPSFHAYSIHNIGLTNPVLRVSDNYILCFDRGGKHLYVADSFNILFHHVYEKGIINAAIGNDGVLAVAVNSDDEESEGGISDTTNAYKGTVIVYDNEYRKIFRWWASDAYITDVILTMKNNISVVTVEADNASADTVVRSFNYRSKDGQERNTIRVDDRIPLISTLKDDGSVEIFTPYDVVSIRGSGYNVIRQFNGEEIVTVARSRSSAMTVAIVDESKRIYTVTAFDNAGNVLFTQDFESVSSVACDDDAFYVQSGKIILKLDRNGSTVATQKLDSGALAILPGQRLSLLVGVNRIYRMDLTETVAE